MLSVFVLSVAVVIMLMQWGQMSYLLISNPGISPSIITMLYSMGLSRRMHGECMRREQSRLLNLFVCILAAESMGGSKDL